MSAQSQPGGAADAATPTAQPSTAHTPGPWFIQQGFRSIYSLSGGDVGLTTFITKPEGHQCGEAQADANARLIAAAPDLLEALRGAIGALEFSQDYHRDLGNEDQAFAADKLDAARAAIAKAEGQ